MQQTLFEKQDNQNQQPQAVNAEHLVSKPGHPAKYTDCFLPIFADKLKECKNVYDPFGGTGKIGDIKNFGFCGSITICEIEREWPQNSKVDRIIVADAEDTPELGDCYFDAICTSPTYGNRMADHFEANDGSKRITYRHKLGKPLNEQNTGRMQWGKKYRDKHERIYKELYRVLKPGGLFILNMSDHIRGGKVVNVVNWHIETLRKFDFDVIEDMRVSTPRMGFGSNAEKRVGHERIVTLRKAY